MIEEKIIDLCVFKIMIRGMGKTAPPFNTKTGVKFLTVVPLALVYNPTWNLFAGWEAGEGLCCCQCTVNSGGIQSRVLT